MKTQDLKKCAKWFENSARILPWRNEPSPYRVWISEIMLQQTQVITVIPFFEKFIARFPTVESLASAPLEDVLTHWSGLGYYSRARNIHAAAALIVRDGFPETREGWESLPGVGPYTAGAILSIAYHKNEAIVDGNVERVLSRVNCFGSRDRAVMWEASRKFLALGVNAGIDPSVVNQSLMELGARVCKPKTPLCSECPLSRACQAFKQGEMESYPVKKIRAKSVEVKEVSTVYLSRDRMVLIALDSGVKWRKGLWDLPSDQFKVPKLKLVRALVPDLKVKYVVTKHRVTRTLKIKYVDQSSLKLKSTADYKWVDLNEVGQLPHGASLKKSLIAVRANI